MDVPRVCTLVDLLRYRAAHQPDTLYTFVTDDDGGATEITYAGLERRARAIATHLQQFTRPNDRVLLLLPSGLDYIAAFFGCLYAGAVAVPAFPPRASRLSSRVQAIAADAQPALALVSSAGVTGSSRRNDEDDLLDLVPQVAIDTIDDGLADRWRTPALAGDTLAFLQYTSGSTRTPHGVMLNHSHLLHNLALGHHGIETSKEDVCVSWAPLYHDMGLIWGVLQPLFAGLPLVLLSPTAFAERPVRWLSAISRYRGSISGAPNFAYQLCADRLTAEERASLDLTSWRLAFCGAEPIRSQTLTHFADTFAPCGFHRSAFFPGYGLAEATLIVTRPLIPGAPTLHTVARADLEEHVVRTVPPDSDGAVTLVGCGQALRDQVVAIVDPETRTRCLPARVGEVWVAGPSVAAGYWQRPETSRETFHAYLADSGEGPYLRTGDLGFLQEGELFITGRLKELIIVRGRNYYPHDIEQTAEYSHPALQPHGGAAFAIDGAGEEHLVIAHELRRSQRHADPEVVAAAIRRAVAEEQELAVRSILLLKPGGLPRTSSGKPQRTLCRSRYLAGTLDALAEVRLDGAQAADQPPLVSPTLTPTETIVAAIWAEVLGSEAGDLQRSFFDLGGDSLLATQIVARVRERCQVELPLRTLFDAPTVAALAAAIDSLSVVGAAVPGPVAGASAGATHLPLSPAQERMWVAYQVQPESVAYSIPVGIRLAGRLDMAALAQSLDALVARHASLRTTFAMRDGAPVQVVAPPQPCPLTVIDLRQLPHAERELAAQRHAEEEARRPFDLEQGPLFRVCLLLLAEDDQVLVANSQHTIADAWSYGLLVRELGELYAAAAEGRSPHLPPPSLAYADFAAWQRNQVQGAALEEQLRFWRAKLAGVTPLEIPSDFPRPATPSQRGARRTLRLPEPLLAALQAVSRHEDVTLFMTMLAAFDLLLYRYTGQEDFVVGTPIANRRWQASEAIIGTFVNTLAVRTRLAGHISFRALLAQVRTETLEAFAHQDLPFDQLIADLRPDRTTGHPPLAQVLFNMINVPVPALRFGGLTGTQVEFHRGASQVDMTLTVAPVDGTQVLTLEYNSDLLAAPTAARMLDHYLALLEQIAAGNLERAVDDFRLLTPAEWQRQLLDWNATTWPYPVSWGVHQLFALRAAETPDAVAVTAPLLDGPGEGHLTYGELDRRANCLANYLRARGVGPEVIVGIYMERAPELLVALLGILKAGGAYLPLDPAFPPDRLAYMLADASTPFLLTQARLLPDLPAHQAQVVCIDSAWPAIAASGEGEPASVTTPDSLAYLLYTSGSTGRPKGVQISHRALTNFLCSMAREPGMGRHDVLLAVTTLSFDIAGLELFLPLIAGAQVVLASRQTAADGAKLASKLAACGATVMQATPVTWRLLLEAGWTGDPRLRILCGGEALPRDLAGQLLGMCGELWNLYGPTETTIWSTVERVRPDRPISIGRPIANTQIYILNARLQPAPIGVAGDLYIGGDGLARGYLNQAALTAERFVPDPFSRRPGARMYKTGDRARYLPDGSIDFLGRQDQQVKLRGFRIELGEIEAMLRSHPAIHQAVAVVREDRPGDRRLVAYVVTTEGQALATGDLRSFLKQHLPDYMLPAAFVALPALPLTPNNKIDRKALPPPETADATPAAVSPRTPTERRLATIWEALLDLRPIGATDDFFDLGGHSLLGVRMLMQVQAVFGVNLPLSCLFPSATIQHLATLVDTQGRIAHWPSLVALQPEGSRPPFYCVHGITGDILWFRELARELAPDQPFYGIQARGLDGVQPPHATIESMARQYVAEIRAFQPDGPYSLGGASFGGAVALEMSRQLREQGEEVALLVIFDHAPPNLAGGRRQALWQAGRRMGAFVRNLPHWLRDLSSYTAPRMAARLRRKLRVVRKQSLGKLWRIGVNAREFEAADLIDYADELPDHRQRLIESHYQAIVAYRPSPYTGRVLLVRARTQPLLPPVDPVSAWQAIASHGLEVRVVPGSHEAMFTTPHVSHLGRELDGALQAAHARAVA